MILFEKNSNLLDNLSVNFTSDHFSQVNSHKMLFDRLRGKDRTYKWKNVCHSMRIYIYISLIYKGYMYIMDWIFNTLNTQLQHISHIGFLWISITLSYIFCRFICIHSLYSWILINFSFQTLYILILYYILLICYFCHNASCYKYI